MMRLILNLTIWLALVSCAGQSASLQTGADLSTPAADDGRLITTAACSSEQIKPRLADSHRAVEGLDPRRISVLNWNTQKASRAGLFEDLARLGNDADLLLLQEAIVDSDRYERLDSGFSWIFSQGYQQTGVMTASKVLPIDSCNMRVREPWLRSPKVISITRYALNDSDDSLLVVNLHLINFTLGVDAFAKQLAQAAERVRAHKGPVLVAGDFNTWSATRDTLVAQRLRMLGLRPVEFETDRRTQFFGHAVDHLYVRGLRPTSAASHAVASSDHNPFSVVLEVL